jgi:hypothetical protein
MRKVFGLLQMLKYQVFRHVRETTKSDEASSYLSVCSMDHSHPHRADF